MTVECEINKTHHELLMFNIYDLQVDLKRYDITITLYAQTEAFI